MPREPKPPRLYLYERTGRQAVWIIRDAGKDQSTRCGQSDVEGANQALAKYLQQKWTPPKRNGRLDLVTVADVICLYIREHMPLVANQDFILYTAAPVNEWWGNKKLSTVNRSTCAAYMKWRVAQGVKRLTTRHDLKTLRAAIGHYHASSHRPLDALPVVTMPRKPASRKNYFWTRQRAAQRLRAARRCPHLARLLLIGLYTGTRPGAIMRLRWVPSTHDGWFDLESGTLHRKGDEAAESNKRAPPVRIHARPLPWLKRWHATDMAAGCTFVVNRSGRAIASVDTSWETTARTAGHARRDGPHNLRHTCATWLMRAGVDVYEAAGYLGMSAATPLETYGHHHPEHQAAAAQADGRLR